MPPEARPTRSGTVITRTRVPRTSAIQRANSSARPTVAESSSIRIRGGVRIIDSSQTCPRSSSERYASSRITKSVRPPLLRGVRQKADCERSPSSRRSAGHRSSPCGQYRSGCRHSRPRTHRKIRDIWNLVSALSGVVYHALASPRGRRISRRSTSWLSVGAVNEHVLGLDRGQPRPESHPERTRFRTPMPSKRRRTAPDRSAARGSAASSELFLASRVYPNVHPFGGWIGGESGRLIWIVPSRNKKSTPAGCKNLSKGLPK